MMKKITAGGVIMKKILKPILCVVLALLVLALAYVAYVLIAYHRIGDQPLTPEGETGAAPAAGARYEILSWNIGFGAYEADYDFFMDGGKQSRAWSPERLDANLAVIAETLHAQNADLCLVQEVDIDATRSYHRDERVPLISAMGGGYCRSFAQNYDSPYLLYPLTRPHGASRSGLLSFSRFDIGGAERVELPVETGLTKLLDLDRCYAVNHIPMAEGRELVLYNFHLSAYSSDGAIATEQLKLLLADMQAQYDAGNYCIAGGDFNKDLLGDSSVWFGRADREYTWAQPIPAGTLEEFDVTLAAPLDEAAPVPSCRNPDSAYHPGQYVLTVDGFLVTDNVTVEDSRVLDLGFACSDHNPVAMSFVLNGGED